MKDTGMEDMGMEDTAELALDRALHRVLGRSGEIVASPGTYDQKHFARIAGVPHCVAYGPGILDLAHQPDEYCDIADLMNATTRIDSCTSTTCDTFGKMCTNILRPWPAPIASAAFSLQTRQSQNSPTAGMQLSIGPYIILGRLHIPPGQDPMRNVLQREPMIPFTGVTMAYSVAGKVVARFRQETSRSLAD